MIAIAARSLNNVIGANGTIPWRSKADFKWFKEFTMGKTLVVGRTTFEQLPYLPGRRIIVLCHKMPTSPVIGRYEPWELRLTNDIDSLPRNAIIAGGAAVYERLLPHCSELHLTTMNIEVAGDTQFPPFKHLFARAEILKMTGELSITKYSR